MLLKCDAIFPFDIRLYNFSYWLSNYLEENVWYNVMSVNTDKVEFYVHGYPLPQIPK